MVLAKGKWAVIFLSTLYSEAELIEASFHAAKGKLGITVVEEPHWCQVDVKGKAKSSDYINKINQEISAKKFEVVIVVIGDKNIKAPIKAALDKLGVPS